MIKLHNLSEFSAYPFKDRVAMYCQSCVGLPYLVSSCGEGAMGQVSQAPLFRLDGFDCMTLTNTVMACALSHSEDDFLQWIQNLSYIDSHVDFLTRRHFVSVDWNHCFESVGILRDMTREIVIDGRALFSLSSAYIDRAAWCRHLTLDVIKTSVSNSERQAVLDRLHQTAAQLQAEQVEMAYLPIDLLLRHAEEVMAQFPDVAVVEIIREPDFFIEKVGTQMHVSHIGLVVEGVLYHASTDTMAVVALPLVDYFQKMNTHQQVIGLNVHAFLDAPIKQ